VNRLFVIVGILLLVSCQPCSSGAPKSGPSFHQDTRAAGMKSSHRVVTDEGYETSCIRVKIVGNDYFRCETHSRGYFIIVPEK